MPAATRLILGCLTACLAASCGGGDAPTAQRPEFLQIAKRLQKSDNPYLGTAQLDRIRSEQAKRGLTAAESVDLQFRLAYQLVRLGDVDGAVAAIDEAERGWRALLDPGVDLPPEFHRLRAVIYMRKAEVTNCVAHHVADCCIFPLAGGGVHTDKEPGREAEASLRALLRQQPNDLDAAWLLNIVVMALGEDPKSIPERYRIPPKTLASTHDVGRFVDVAPKLGLDRMSLCGGVIVDDFDQDGFLDIVTSTYDPEASLEFHRNRGDGTFEDQTAARRLDDQLGGLNLIAGDYDGDGDLDLLVLRGAWLFDDGRIRNSLLRQEADGSFTDVTRSVGLADPARPTQTAAWGDFDGDGDLDLYVGNESRRELPKQSGMTDGDFPSQLFRNDGGKFTDVAREAGVTNDRYAKSVAVGDYDDDGDLDIYVSNVGKNRLYRNDGGMRFTDVAESLGVTGPEGRSFATWFFDADEDGRLDLFVAAYDCTAGDLLADRLGLPQKGEPPRLYRNLGAKGFVDVAAQVGLAHPYLPMGANFGDVDGDGWLDVYLGTGDPDYRTLMPNVMLRNDHGQRFEDVTTSGGFGHLQKGHGIAFADIDNDGDQDVFHELGGFLPGDRFHDALFLNPGHGHHFVVVELRGVKSNRLGVGARVAVTVREGGATRTIHRAVGCVSGFGGSPLRQEIGLGDADGIERIEVWWPTSGARQTFTEVPMDARVRVTEGEDQIERLPFQAVRLAVD